MTLFNAISVSSTGMTANRVWLDLISNNIANVNSTKPAGEEPYQRKAPVFAEMLKEVESSTDILRPASMDMDFSFAGDPLEYKGNGVQVYEIMANDSPAKLVKDPSHPHADENGFVKKPNVNMTYEMVDMISAHRGYDANVQAANAAKAMVNKALEIGK